MCITDYEWDGVKRQQEEERQTDRRSGCSLTLSWLHLTCHAVLFCCASHDNCLSGSIEFRDYSGWGELRMGAETRQDSGGGGGGGLIRGSRGSEKIITAITKVGYLKLWRSGECGQSSCFHSPNNMRTRGCCISVIMKGINWTTMPRRPAKLHWPRKSFITTLH